MTPFRPSLLLVRASLAFVFLLAACPDDSESAPDAGSPEIGSDRDPHSGSRSTDAGVDASTNPTDAAADAGDATASPADTGALVDASGDAQPADATVDPDTLISQRGLSLWLRADRGVTHDASGVSRWSDQSPLHADAVQTSASARPAFGRLDPGEPEVVIFDGTDDFLTLPAGYGDFTAGLTIVVLALNHAQDSHAAYFEASNGREIDDISLGRYQGKLLFEVLDDPRAGLDIPVETPVLISTLVRPDGTYSMRHDGASIGVGVIPLPVSVSRSSVFLGRSLYTDSVTLSGALAEVLVYQRALSEQELTDLESTLRARWDCCGP